MPFFETKLRHARFTLSPFTSEDMSDIGETVLHSITDRIRAVTDVNDAPAKPLSPRYAKWKAGGTNKNPGKAPVRDWELRGKTLRSLHVKTASESRCTLGPTDAQSAMIVSVQNQRSGQWGVSPHDAESMREAVRAKLLHHRLVTVTD